MIRAIQKQESYYRKDYKRRGATALAVDNQGRLLVADNGPRLSQVLIYHIRQRPKLVGTVGTQGAFRHTREESDSEILRAHRSWGRLFWEYLRKF